MSTPIEVIIIPRSISSERVDDLRRLLSDFGETVKVKTVAKINGGVYHPGLETIVDGTQIFLDGLLSANNTMKVKDWVIENYKEPHAYITTASVFSDNGA